jgi:hypothetical protein
MEWPEWWNWPLDLSNPHLRKRMSERGFDETELRDALESAVTLDPDQVPGRFVIQCRMHGTSWSVVVEPDERLLVLVVVTAYKQVRS